MKYTWNPNDYEKHSAGQQKWARELIAKLQLKGTEDILDLGCGDGKVTAELAASVQQGNVVGIDNAKEMIILAQNRYPKAENPNLEFRVMDATEVSFNNAFDIVFSNAALHWVKNHIPILEGMYKSLRSGGKILLQMGGKGNAAQVVSILATMLDQEKWQSFFRGFTFPYGFYDPDIYRKWLLDTGFQIRNLALIPKTMKHKGKSGLEGWIRTTWLPYIERVPEHLRERFIAELTEKYIQATGQNASETIEVDMVRLEVEAYKEGMPSL